MGLAEYRRKRHFERTPEPAGKKAPAAGGRGGRFVIQKHDASRLHYDFRLEMEGVLRSWAVPKGPSLDPAERRLAVQVEDHPIEYGGFEGTIPKGQYGGGTVMLWDRGRWFPDGDPVKAWRSGTLEFRLEGDKLHGGWRMVRLRPRPGDKSENWLLMKRHDDEARPLSKGDVLEERAESVKTGRSLDQIASRSRSVWNSNRTDEAKNGSKEKARGAAKRGATSSAANGRRSAGATTTKTAAATRTAKKTAASSDAVTVAGVRLTNPERVLWPEMGLTKLELARYWERVAPRALPHLRDRPLTLLRCPAGRGRTCFIQRHVTGEPPAGVRAVKVPGEKGAETWLAVDDLEGVVSLVQMGVLEIHAWGARAKDAERPDRLVFDLDPDPSVPWSEVIDAARLLRERLEELDLESWVKTTGGKGLHVTVPLRPAAGWDEVTPFCRAVAESLEREQPDRFVATMSKAKRKGRIFVDWMRNARAASAVAVWSPRARENAPVAMPLAWENLTARVKPSVFDVRSVTDYARRTRTDPWKSLATSRQSLSASRLRKWRESESPRTRATR